MTRVRFSDRSAAGRELSERLARYSGRDDVVVLGLPRGGVPVAYEVAKALGVPLDVFVVRKLGVPGHEELAIGAIASGGVRVLNDELVRLAALSRREIDAVTARERVELERRERAYRGDREPIEIEGKTVLAVDDGLATGATMRAAVTAMRKRRAETIVAAVPIAAPQTCARLRHAVEEIVCARTAERFIAVGLWYRDFTPVSDEQVRRMLESGERVSNP